MIDNNKQVPALSLFDLNGKQTYLANAFVAGVPSAPVGATTETPFFLMTNPAGNLKSLFNFLRTMTVVTTTGAIATFRFYSNPTVTSNGTVVTPQNLRVNAASPASTMLCYSLPSVSSKGTFVAEIGSTNSGTPTIFDLLNILDPGNSILVTVIASSGTVPVAFATAWYEI
jgi:hypothetical protein